MLHYNDLILCIILNLLFMKYIYLGILVACVSSLLIFILKKSNFFVNKLSVKDEYVKGSKKIIRISGLGISFLLVFILIFFLYFFVDTENIYPNRFWYFALMLITISLVSFKDDIKPIDPLLRLLIHLICVYVSISFLNLNMLPFPLKVKILVVMITWVYFINITNFIDGSDGFCAINVITFFAGILIINYMLNLNLFSSTISIIVIPILISFLLFNFPPAKIYMGDAGSIFLGFLVGYSFIELSINGYLFFALALYAYPLTDCSITLFKKVLKGYLPWARLGDYFFLKLKKRISEKHMIKATRFIFFSMLFSNSINLFIIYLSIKFNEPLLLFICLVISLILLFVYQILSIANSNFLKFFFRY